MNKYFLIAMMALCACTSPVANQSNDEQEDYFDMPNFVAQQLDQLNSKGASVTKRQEVNKKIEEISQDSIDWGKELTLFEEANINKPVLKGSYEVNETTDGTTTYTSLNEKNKVKVLQVIKKGEIVAKIAIEWEDNNPIYHSAKALKMDFEEGKLITYAIHGYQKMIGNDTLFYNLDAQVNYP